LNDNLDFLTSGLFGFIDGLRSTKDIKTDQTRNSHDMLSSLVSPNNLSLLKPIKRLWERTRISETDQVRQFFRQEWFSRESHNQSKTMENAHKYIMNNVGFHTVNQPQHNHHFSLKRQKVQFYLQCLSTMVLKQN
jgi:hypothetical protein